MNHPNYKYDWGETVRVIATAPEAFRPGTLCSVCGMRDTDDGPLYLVEFGDGEAVEILEGLLIMTEEWTIS